MGPISSDGVRLAGQVAFAAAAVFVLASVAPSDGPRWLFSLILLACSPLVGDFSATMAARYAPSMDWRACFRRMAAPSRCDGCGAPLGQLDMIPFFSSAALTGRCSCGECSVPRSYGLWSATSLAGVLALIGLAWASGDVSSSLVPAGLFLAFFPAIGNDVTHGEVDPAVLSLGVFLGLALGIFELGLAGALMGLFVGVALLGACGAVAWMAVAPSQDGGRPFPVGAVDFAVAGASCSILGPSGLASFLVWCVPCAVVALAAVAASARLAGRYGPVAGGDRFAFPMVPVIVCAACIASLMPVA